MGEPRHRLAQLDELGIQADIILLHPYDKPEWGFSKMTREEDAFYLAYVARRYSAFRNVWWSLANEFDLMPWKSVEDWDSYARIVMANARTATCAASTTAVRSSTTATRGSRM